MNEELKKLLARLEEISNLEEKTPEVMSEVEKIKARVGEIKNALDIEAVKDSIASIGSKPEVRSTQSQAPQNSLHSFGTWAQTLASTNNRIANGEQGTDGGYLIPPDYRKQILSKNEKLIDLTPYCTTLYTQSNSVEFPKSEDGEYTPAGIKAFWESERGLSLSNPSFGTITVRLHRLTVLCKVTRDLLEDAIGLEDFINSQVNASYIHKVNQAILNGSGAGEPEGILKSTYKIAVPKESAQEADTIVVANLAKMLASLNPASMNNAIWLIHSTVIPALVGLQIGTTPVFVPAGGLSASPFNTLFGRPVIITGDGAAQLGDEGDIILADLSCFYLVKKTAGVRRETSTEAFFLDDQVAFKFIFRVGGQVVFTHAIKDAADHKTSAIVTLQSR